MRRTALPETCDQVHVVLQLNSPRTVQLHLLQCLSDHIVRLSLGVLDGLDRRGLVYIALVVNVELSEGIRETVDLRLRELGIFLRRMSVRVALPATGP